MKMKLFIDDHRDIPEDVGFTAVARNYTQAILLIDIMEYETISCDGNLEDPLGNGLDIVNYLIQKQKFPKNFNVHSTHIDLCREMYNLAKKEFKNCNVTFNSYK